MRKPNCTSSEASFSHAMSWVNECTEKHSCLVNSSPSNVMPRRVLDVGVSAIGDVRLHVLNGHVVKYITLSHCWGSNQQASPLKTTKATLEKHLAGITMSSLSKTFQDAIVFTRRLQVRYLWIDSLCIYSSRSGIKGSSNQQSFIQHQVIFNLTFFNLALIIYNR